jgi:putative ABC transport system ATP-binding protein
VVSQSNNDSLLSVDQVTKQYRRGNRDIPVLRNISCQISQGDFVFIVGPSGSGKSTLLYLMGGLDQPSSGEISIASQSLSKMSPKSLDQLRRQDVGFIFQSFNLLRTMNCIDNVLAPFIPTGEANLKRKEAEELLTQVGLGERMHHRPSELSGGEQQRVAIARAILKKPKLILADEPTGELDSETGRQVFEILRKLNREQGTTVITVTHDQRYMNEDQDIVMEMQDGQFIHNEPAA